MSQAAIHRDRPILTCIWAFVPHLDPAKVAYGVKLALALLIAVWVELWFNLGMADSAAICVLVIKSNFLGTTIQKSVLRMIGNLIGCSIGLAFIALFAQDRIAGAVAFSLYSVFCCFFLQRSRYAPAWHWTYNSAAIVFLFHLGSATESFTFTAQRWLELSIGIASMTLVSSILWPSRAGTVFERKFLSTLEDLAADVGSVRTALSSTNESHMSATLGKLAVRIPALRSDLDTASRDTFRYEQFHDGYESLVDGLQSLIARATLLAGSVSNLIGTTNIPARHLHSITAAIDHLKASMRGLVEDAHRHFDELSSGAGSPDTRAIHSAIEHIRSEMTTTDYSFRDAATTLYVCETITSLANGIERFTAALASAGQKTKSQPKLSSVRPLDSDDTRLWKRLDVRKSLVCGLTIALAFTVWMMTNWPAGPFGIFSALLVTSKNCTAPYLPPKALIPGTIAGCFVGAVIYLGVLPKLDGFLQLALVLFPLCTVSGYLMLSSNAKVAGVVGLTTIWSIKLMNLEAHQTFSFSHVVGFSYGILGGIVLAFIVLTVMWPIVPEKMFTSQVKSIFTSCHKWLRAVSIDVAASSLSRATFAQASARQLGLCVMWSKFLNYGRLPEDCRETVDKLISTIQVTVFHLIELERARQYRHFVSHSPSLAAIVQRLNLQLCEVLDRLVDALEQWGPVPHLPAHTKGLLDELHRAFDELCEGIGDEAPRRDVACHVLAMIGQYAALVGAVAECHTCLEQLDWKTLNQDYF